MSESDSTIGAAGGAMNRHVTGEPVEMRGIVPIATPADSLVTVSQAYTSTTAAQAYTPMVAPQAYTPIVARVPITIREGVMADLPFIDRLQKKQSRELGFLPTQALEGKIKLGQVLVAESSGQWPVVSGQVNAKDPSSLTTDHRTPNTPLGYLIAADRYLHRDELGYVTQINIVPEFRRSLVAAQLLQAQFDRSAHGCRLYCCWCAQDLKANDFWEAMGFVPLAFRAGGRGRNGDAATKRRSDGGEGRNSDEADSVFPSVASSLCRSVASSRVHIFWQKRIRAGDETTPFWYPSTTGNGQMRADRLVFPIPAGMHWSEVGPMEIGGESDRAVSEVDGDTATERTGERTGERAGERAREKRARQKQTRQQQAAVELASPRGRGGLWFVQEGVPRTESTLSKAITKTTVKTAVKTTVKTAVKTAVNTAAQMTQGTKKVETQLGKREAIDPALKQMARRLRDQWFERTATGVRQTGQIEARHDVKRLAA